MQIWAVLGLVLVMAGAAFYVDRSATARAEGDRIHDALARNQERAEELRKAEMASTKANTKLHAQVASINEATTARVQQIEAKHGAELDRLLVERDAAIAAGIVPALPEGELQVCPADCRVE